MSVGRPLYTIDTETGTTTATYPDGTVIDSSFAEATGKPYRILDGRVFDMTTGRIVDNVGTQGPMTIQELEGGRTSVTVFTTANSVNRPTETQFLGRTASVQQQVGGQFSVVDALGNEHTINMGGATPTDAGAYLNVFDRQRLVFTDAKGNKQSTATLGRYANNAQVAAELGPDYRLATPRETADRAIRYWLSENAREVLMRIQEAGGIGGQTPTADVYSLAVQLASLPTLDQLNFSTSYLLEAP